MKFRPRFSLKMLLLLVAVIGLFCAYHANWICQRHAFLAEHAVEGQQFYALRDRSDEFGILFLDIGAINRTKHTFNLLWLFREPSCQIITLVLKTDSEPPIISGDDNWTWARQNDSTTKVDLAERLFPEAEIWLAVFKPKP